MFRVYSAILSIIGKKQFVRITARRISYRMQGFKSKEVQENETQKSSIFLTDRQIRTISEKLCQRGLIDKRTYKKRLTFYSVLYRDAELNDLIVNSITVKKFRREKNRMESEKITIEIDQRFEELKTKFLNS